MAIALALCHKVIDGIRLVTVGDDGLAVQAQHRVVNDQSRILHLALIKSLGANATTVVLLKHTVTGIDAAPHNKIGDHCRFPVLAATQHDPTAGIAVAGQQG